MGMLDRIFSRGAPENRIERAVEHQEASEEREMLRQRSETILKRLDRKKRQMRDGDDPKVTVEPAPAIDDTPEPLPAVEQAMPVHPQTSEAVSESHAGIEPEAFDNREVLRSEPSLNETPSEESIVTEPADDPVAYTPDESASAEEDEPEDTLFAESGPLRDDIEQPAEAGYPAPEPAAAEPQAANEPEQPQGDSDDLRKLRLKAEEARARVAARLKANEGLRRDLGADVPPIYHEAD